MKIFLSNTVLINNEGNYNLSLISAIKDFKKSCPFPVTIELITNYRLDEEKSKFPPNKKPEYITNGLKNSDLPVNKNKVYTLASPYFEKSNILESHKNLLEPGTYYYSQNTFSSIERKKEEENKRLSEAIKVNHDEKIFSCEQSTLEYLSVSHAVTIDSPEPILLFHDSNPILTKIHSENPEITVHEVEWNADNMHEEVLAHDEERIEGNKRNDYEYFLLQAWAQKCSEGVQDYFYHKDLPIFKDLYKVTAPLLRQIDNFNKKKNPKNKEKLKIALTVLDNIVEVYKEYEEKVIENTDIASDHSSEESHSNSTNQTHETYERELCEKIAGILEEGKNKAQEKGYHPLAKFLLKLAGFVMAIPTLGLAYFNNTYRNVFWHGRTKFSREIYSKPACELKKVKKKLKSSPNSMGKNNK